MKLRTGRTLAAVAGALVSLAVSLHSSPARALCADPASCICSPASLDHALIVTVSSVGQKYVDAVVSKVITRPDELPLFAPGDPVVIEVDGIPDGPPLVGEDLLVTNEVTASGGSQLHVVSRIGADGQITCQYAPEYRPDAEEAAQHALSDTCFEDVNEEIGPVECNDTVTSSGCSTPGGGMGGIGSVGAALGALGLAMGAVRRRRRSC